MPINIDKALPAYRELMQENVFVMAKDRAIEQDIRPLNILILNLMPDKAAAETQLLRLLANTPLQLNVEFLRVSRETRHTPKAHMENFYRRFNQIKHRKFDGLIITGAPVENLPYEEVSYWDELCEILDWSERYVYSVLFICWSAMAGLYHFYGIPKHLTGDKISGIYRHYIEDPSCRITCGFDDYFYAVHSRYAEVRHEDFATNPKALKELRLISSSPDGGLYLLQNTSGRRVFVTGHAEYEIDTLKQEYIRDKNRNIKPYTPENYFPEDGSEQLPYMTWRAHATLLFTNWINYYVYQETPYDLVEIQ